MTLDCRTLWSVRFCAAKGHFCSLLLSNILVTSAFCRLTIFSNWFPFHIPKFFHLCPFLRDALTGWNFIQSINRLTVPSEISEFAIFDYSQQLLSLLLLSEKTVEGNLSFGKVLSFCDYILSWGSYFFKREYCTIYLISVCILRRFPSLMYIFLLTENPACTRMNMLGGSNEPPIYFCSR